MKNGIELLRDISAELPPIVSSDRLTLPQGKLRFMLEYQTRPNLEDERLRLKALLSTDHFELIYLPDNDSNEVSEPVDEFGVFLILQFPTLERTLSHRSLFDTAYALEAELELMTVEPDLGSTVYADPQPPTAQSEEQVEGIIADVFTADCWVEKDAPSNKRWAIDKMRIPQAWDLASSQGEGVLIAQPDTGISAHTSLINANINLGLATNLVEGNDDPTDPLDSAHANPGHGTGTCSVISSKDSPLISGAAPGASLIPIRCVDDVKIFDTAPLVAAINHARAVGSHVITMSLGGIASRAMKKAIRKAVNNDIIVVAAAGNCVDLVVWPARYRDVIAVGGSNIDDLPWKGSSQGDDVDICAPAELVWVARRKPDDTQLDLIEGAQGTSFATALTAGTAALWLAHHGRDVLIDTARSAGVSLQDLFRQALMMTATKPAGWPTGDYGAGIINAEALLLLSPAQIMQAQRRRTPSTPPAADALLAELAQLNGAQAIENGTSIAHSLHRFEREISASLLETASRGALSSTTARQESSVIGHALSDTLRQVVNTTDDPLLKPLRQVKPAVPASRVSQRITDADAATIARLSLKPEQLLDSTSDNVIKKKLDTLEKRINNSPLSSDSSASERENFKNEVMQDSEKILNSLKKGNTIPANDVRATTALEALVKMQGRPAIRLTEQAIDINDPELQEWVGVLAMLKDVLPEMGKSVGRIDADGIHQGTGFVVAPGIVLTNRHVVEGFAAPIPSAHRPDRWMLERDASINFSPSADDRLQCFRINDIVFTGPDPISGDPLINHDELDMALVLVESTNSHRKNLPPPLQLGTSVRKCTLNKKLFAIGYPAAPASFPKDENGHNRADVADRIRKLFGMDYGVCYLSPGLVEMPVSTLTHGHRPISFQHDATTLGGSSGSCLLSCDSALDVIGLHYGGDWLRANFAHDIAHVSNTLINLPTLIKQISKSLHSGSQALAAATAASKVSPDIELSAINVGPAGTRV